MAFDESLPRVLVVTNDFPPRVGGVQQYVWNLVRLLPPDLVAVVAPAWTGWQVHDRGLPFAVHRVPRTFLWPTPALGRLVRGLVREHRADVVLFGHGFPLPLLGPGLAGRGTPYAVLTHGAEIWMERSPGLGALFRRALSRASVVTVISRDTGRTIGRALPGGLRPVLLPPGVDETRFDPRADGSAVRDRLGLGDSPVVACVSRLVPRKGQDVLIRGLPDLHRLVPAARLLIVGDGPDRDRLRALAGTAPAGSVVFAGEASDDELPYHYAACDVFAMPCRSRWGGLEVEGFGIVFLEAAAAARPVVAGRSGGAAEAVRDGVNGLLVEGGEPRAVALTIANILRSPDHGAAMGAAGRRMVEESFTWTSRVERLGRILARAAGGR